MFIVHKIVFPLNLLFVFMLLLSYLTPWANPQDYWFISFLGLVYPILLAVNILFVIYWALFLKLKVLYSVAAILCGLNHLSHNIQLKGEKNELKQPLKVFSFNCNFFGYGLKKTADTGPFFEYIKNEKPDIICFQEFMWEMNKRKNYIQKSRNSMGSQFDYFYNAYKAMDTIHREYGQYIISRYPIINKGAIEFGTNKLNRCIYIDIKKNGDTIRVYNTHLESIKLDDEDYKVMNDKDQSSQQIERTKNIITKMKGAFQRRAIQAQTIADHIQSCPYQTILCGDFNDTPVSYTYAKLTEKMKDAFVESGVGFSRTYAGIMPSFRIDYILSDEGSNVSNYQLGEHYFSDHHLIQANISWSK